MFSSITASVLLGASVGVLCTGDDARETGELQAALEATLSGVPQVTVIPTSKRALVKSGDPLPQADKGAVQFNEQLMKKVEAAFYDDQLDIALAHLSMLEDLAKDNAVLMLGSDIAQLFLWRTAILHAQNKPADARRAALLALTLHPELKVDLDVFNPNIARLVKDTRKNELRMVRITLSGLPDGARIAVDGRGAKNPMEIPVGPHVFAVTAPGHRAVIRRLQVKSPSTLAVPLPPKLQPGLLRELQSPSADVLANVARRLGLDVVVVATARGEEVRAAVWSKAGGAKYSEPLAAGSAEAATWVRENVERKPPPNVEPTPAPTPSVRAPVQGHWETDGGVTFGVRSQTVGSNDLGGLDTGAGVRVVAAYVTETFRVDLDAAFVMHQTELSFLGLETTARARTRFGYALPARLWVSAGVSLDYHNDPNVSVVSFPDPSTELGAFDPVTFPTYTRVGPEVGISGQWQLAPPLTLEAGVWWAPASLWADSIRGPDFLFNPTEGLGAQVRANWKLADPWTVVVELEGSRRELTVYDDASELGAGVTASVRRLW